MGRTDHAYAEALASGLDQVAVAQVAEVDVARVGDQHIFRLDVPVGDVVWVQGFKANQQGVEDVGDRILIHDSRLHQLREAHGAQFDD